MAETVNVPAAADSGSQGSNDPTLVSGQDPTSLFGVTISYESGAAGTAGASSQPEGDSTNEPGQYPATEPISGVSLTGMSGAPGGPGAEAGGGGGSVTITDPNYMAGKPGGGSGNQFISVPATLSGPDDSTTVPGQYASGVANAMPDMKQPTATGAGQGRVLHGGYMKGQR